MKGTSDDPSMPLWNGKMSKKFEFYIASRTSSKMHSGLAPRYLGVDSREDANQGLKAVPMSFKRLVG